MTWAVVGGIVSAATAAACFDGGLAVQALDAREVHHEHNLKPSLLVRLAGRKRWLAGTALALGGWPFHLIALALAPLSLVQPTLALGLILLLYLGHRVLGEPVGRLEIAAVAGLVVAVAILAWAAPPETSHHSASTRVAIGMVPLAVIALLPLAAGRIVSPSVLPLASGAAYAFTGISSKLLVDDLRDGKVEGVLFWALATAVLGFTGLLLEMSALQKRPATFVGPMVFVVQVTVPVLLAPLVSGESWSDTPLSGGVILMSVAAVCVSAVALTRSRAVAAFADELAGR